MLAGADEVSNATVPLQGKTKFRELLEPLLLLELLHSSVILLGEDENLISLDTHCENNLSIFMV